LQEAAKVVKETEVSLLGGPMTAEMQATAASLGRTCCTKALAISMNWDEEQECWVQGETPH